MNELTFKVVLQLSNKLYRKFNQINETISNK